ncbi:capsular polysaccharide export protein [Sphingomonas sp. PP-F2F-G114-C0414]|uniref:capsular polysaccharide export protein, LipB/KpsS family n=1 Tax=Sphingomonas sp. PP-F2F-G114-C0414 TaxID=2135662 RepID=UPI000F1E9B6F|nr:beta-3-deoxy-D-manno-oct-2-ulosonic acid transferase [Sphingomonas sp. PP-F2F-G114-C0414]RMB25770.1 capsular polysaccharide export protein [Sphingomonas sp. PP-F2F-G114-C0414]
MRDAKTVPLLRAPPFPGAAVTYSGPIPATDGAIAPAVEQADIARIFAAIREARVGGPFWERPAAASDARTIVRARSASEVADLRAGMTDAEQDAVVWLLPADRARDPALRVPHPRGAMIFGEVDPWSLLDDDVQLVAHGDDEWVALADIAGSAVRILSDGAYGTPDTPLEERRQRIATALFDTRYRDPATGLDTGIDATIAHLGFWRRIGDGNRGIVAACGIAWWKRREIARFLWSPDRRVRYFSSERRAIAHAKRHGGTVAVWPSRISPAMVRDAAAADVPLVRVEDGFVRSVGLGSDMVPPSSITVDWRGIHYDPSRASDLETLLAETQFPPALLARAAHLRAAILAGGISKYGGNAPHVFPARQPGRRLVLVPGQVEDDMSVKLGGGGLASNLELLRRARALEPDAELWFRPHPDVDAGHRKGAVPDADALAVADRIVRGGGMAALLERVDAVHVLTSLTGFEALLRGCDVTCHGMPFYAGWGLTRDLMSLSDRRGRVLALDELVAGVLILYPRYLDPVSGLPCEPETLFARMVAGDAVNRLGWVTRLRQIQGRLMKGRR